MFRGGTSVGQEHLQAGLKGQSTTETSSKTTHSTGCHVLLLGFAVRRDLLALLRWVCCLVRVLWGLNMASVHGL